MIKVIVDVDDTCVDLLPVWVDCLNSRHKLHIDYKSIKEWDMQKTFTMLTKEQIYAPLRDEILWANVLPKKDCIKYLKMLSVNPNIEIYLCTATHPATAEMKYTYCMKRHFDFINEKNYILTYSKDMIDADVIVDDGLHNMGRKRKLNLLMNTNYNQNCSIDYVTRVNNWKEIADKILQLIE